MYTLSDLTTSPNALAPHYTHFRVDERVLLSGHSHQAWPDVGLDALKQSWLDAAAYVDGKWDLAEQQAQLVREGFAALLGNPGGDIALAENTHHLIVAYLSALPLRERPRIVTTDAEFHTIRRQLDRLGEEFIELHKVPAFPVEDVATRLAEAVDDRTATVMVSAVFFKSSRIVPGLGELQSTCDRNGARLLVDAYHALGVVPYELVDRGLANAYVVGGGYKYLQLGEGACFLRTPAGCDLEPLVTGWFSEFGLLASDQGRSGVRYGSGPSRWAGATYDPASHYRAAASFRFFREHGLTAGFLRQISQHQVGLLTKAFDALDLDPRVIRRDTDVALDQVGGFLVLTTPHAQEIVEQLLARGVFSDSRGDSLRLGPAPYLSDDQLERGMDALGDVVRAIGGRSA